MGTGPAADTELRNALFLSCMIAICVTTGLATASAQTQFLIPTYGSSLDRARENAATAAFLCYVGLDFQVSVVDGKVASLSVSDSGIETWASQVKLIRTLEERCSPGFAQAIAVMEVKKGPEQRNAADGRGSVSFTHVTTEMRDCVVDREVDRAFGWGTPTVYWLPIVCALTNRITGVAKCRTFKLRGRIFRTQMILSREIFLRVCTRYRLEVSGSDLDDILDKETADRVAGMFSGEVPAHAPEFICGGPEIRNRGRVYKVVVVSSSPVALSASILDLDEVTRAGEVNAQELVDWWEPGNLRVDFEEMRALKRSIARVLHLNCPEPWEIYIGLVH